jgi:transglutaminase-like putative cysteine protease
MGIPTKYVSGYMETLPPPSQEKLVGADATHAWLAYYSPQESWIEFDPTDDVHRGVQHMGTA